jgi:hypothetical protein
MHPMIGLPLWPLECKGPISHIEQGIKHTFGRTISLRSKSLQPCVWAFFHGMDAKEWGAYLYERGASRQYNNLMVRCCIRSQSRAQRLLPQLSNRHYLLTHLSRYMGHPQQKTPVHCDNATAVGIANNTIKCQHSRSTQMRFFWIGDKVAHDMYALSWHPGQENLADYQSKHHIGSHHVAVRTWYLHMEKFPPGITTGGKT